MRKYFRMPVFFLALFTSVQDKDGSSLTLTTTVIKLSHSSE